MHLDPGYKQTKQCINNSYNLCYSFHQVCVELKILNYWKFSELKILHTRTPPYNPSSNILERWHRTIVSILRTMGREMQNEWDLGVKAACLAYNTTVHGSTGQTLFFATQYPNQIQRRMYLPGQRLYKKDFKLPMLG